MLIPRPSAAAKRCTRGRALYKCKFTDTVLRAWVGVILYVSRPRPPPYGETTLDSPEPAHHLSLFTTPPPLVRFVLHPQFLSDSDTGLSISPYAFARAIIVLLYVPNLLAISRLLSRPCSVRLYADRTIREKHNILCGLNAD